MAGVGGFVASVESTCSCLLLTRYVVTSPAKNTLVIVVVVGLGLLLHLQKFCDCVLASE